MCDFFKSLQRGREIVELPGVIARCGSNPSPLKGENSSWE